MVKKILNYYTSKDSPVYQDVLILLKLNIGLLQNTTTIAICRHVNTQGVC